jgi:hypothetical protein
MIRGSNSSSKHTTSAVQRINHDDGMYTNESIDVAAAIDDDDIAAYQPN